MRSAGCIVNDLTDRDIDAKVERTRTRPLASGEVTPKEAYILIAILLFLSFLVALAMGWKVVLLGALWLPLVVAYPWMKRITYWPQAFLGLTFNAGALFGWLAVKGTIELPALLLYIGAIFWTLAYDTIYAHQDAEDDALIGIKSTARLFGARTHLALVVFYTLAVVLIGLALVSAVSGLPACIGLAAFAVHLARQIRRLDISDSALCLKLFKSNRDAGLLLFAGLLADALLRAGT